MEQQSPYALMRTLENDAGILLSAVDLYALDSKPRALAAALKSQLIDARLDLRDYEYADTKAEQANLGHAVVSRLEAVRQTILAASEYGLFSAVEVVHLSTRLDSLLTELK